MLFSDSGHRSGSWLVFRGASATGDGCWHYGGGYVGMIMFDWRREGMCGHHFICLNLFFSVHWVSSMWPFISIDRFKASIQCANCRSRWPLCIYCIEKVHMPWLHKLVNACTLVSFHMCIGGLDQLAWLLPFHVAIEDFWNGPSVLGLIPCARNFALPTNAPPICALVNGPLLLGPYPNSVLFSSIGSLEILIHLVLLDLMKCD